MAQQIINIGNTANDGTGSPLRTAFTIVNDNFSELYNLGGVSGIANGTSNISIALNSTINMSSAGTSDVLVIFPTGAVLDGDFEVSTGNISVTGNVITDQFFLGDGSQLSNVTAVADAAEIIGNTLSSNVQFSSLQTVGNLANLSVVGNIITNVTGNISTGNVITDRAVSATGNVQAGNLRTSGIASAAGNITTGANLVATVGVVTAGNVSATGNVEGSFLLGNARFVTGLAAPFANALVGNTLSPNVVNSTLRTLGVLDNLTVSNALGGTGNASMGNISVSSLITSNDQINALNLSATGAVALGTTATLTIANTSATAASVAGTVVAGNVSTGGTVSATGSVTGGNLLTGGRVSATGNVSGNYFFGNGALLTGIVTQQGVIANGSSNVNIPVANANIVVTANSTTSATFTETGVIITGSANAASFNTAGAISAQGNVTTSGFFIGTFQGNITGNITAAGLDTQVMYNKAGNVAGSTGMTFDDTANVFTVSGVISSAGNVVGNGVFLVQNTTTSTSNVTGSLQTLGGMGVAGNLFMGGLLSVDSGVNFNATTQDLNLGNALSTGNVLIGGITQTGNIDIGRSSANANISIGYGATASDRVKTINIGTGAVANSTTTITVGPTVANATITLGQSTANTTTNIASGATASDRTKTLNIGTGGGANSLTTITIGTGAGNANVTFTANTQVNIANTGGSALVVAGNVTGGNISTTSLAATGAVQFTATTQDINIGNAQTTGNVLMGGPNQSGIITLGQSDRTHTLNIDAGATVLGNTRTINIGTNGVANSTTVISIGTTLGNATVTLEQSTANTELYLASGISLSNRTKSVFIGTGGAAGSTTALTLGPGAANSTVNVSPSFANSTVNIGYGATASDRTKTINVGTGGVANSTTTMTMGPAAGNSFITIGQATANTSNIDLGLGTGPSRIFIGVGETSSGNTKTIWIGTGGLTNSTTNMSFGPTAGNSSIGILPTTDDCNVFLAIGATASDRTKTLNIGTGGLAGSNTVLTVGPASGNATITIEQSTANTTTNIATGATASDRTKTVNIGTGGLVNSLTTITVGTAAGNANVTFTANTQVNIANTGGSALTVAGNITGGNLRTGGTASVTGTVTGGNVVTGGNLSVASAVQFTATTQDINIGNAQTTGNVLMGGSSQTGTITLGQSDRTHTFNIDSGATVAGNTRTINIGTNGVATSTTTVVVGTSLGNSTITISPSTANSTVNLADGATASDRTKTVNIGTGGLVNSLTTITVGTAAGNANVTFTANTQVNIANTGGSALTVGGNITGANLRTAGQVSAGGNITGGNILTGGVVSAAGTVTGGNIVTGGNLSAAAAVQFTATTQDINIGNAQTSGNIVMGGASQTGTITIGQTTANSTINISIGNVLANNTRTVNIATGGAANSNTVVRMGPSNATATGALILNESMTLQIANTDGAALSVAGNVLASNLTTGGRISAVGNIVGDYFIGNGALLTGLGATYGNSQVASFLAAFGSNNISTSGTVTTSNLVAGTNVQFDGQDSAINIGNAQITGTVTIGGLTQTGTITLGRTNDTATLNIGTGQTATTKIKTINLGTGGLAGSNTTITVGAGTGNATVSFTANTTVGIANTSNTALSVAGNVIGNFFIGNGSLLTGISASYGNSNVVTLLASFGSNNISTSGNITADNLIATTDVISSFSDERLKANINPIMNPMDKIMSLRGVTFQPNDLAAKYGFEDFSVQLGVLAQDVERVLPELVKPAPFDRHVENGEITSRSGENFKTIQYERLVPVLIEAIKELKAQIDDLQSKER